MDDEVRNVVKREKKTHSANLPNPSKPKVKTVTIRKMEPERRFELLTYALRVRCSTN